MNLATMMDNGCYYILFDNYQKDDIGHLQFLINKKYFYSYINKMSHTIDLGKQLPHVIYIKKVELKNLD